MKEIRSDRSCRAVQSIFLVSDMGCSEKIDGVRYSKAIDNSNGILEQLKSMIQKTQKMLFFVSDPKIFDKNDNYADLTFKSFRKSGLIFNEEKLIDGRSQGNLAYEIKTADLIFLSGGKTAIQMNFFEDIGLKEMLKDYQGIIIGQSAGAMNLANEVVCFPEDEEEIGQNHTWAGLAKTKINIVPHFVLNIIDELDIQLRNELLKISTNRTLYAICDGSHIFIDDTSAKIYGETYLLENSNITKINDNGIYTLKSFTLPKTNIY